MLSVLQEAKISLLNNMNCANTSVLLTVLCVDIMRHSDGFEAYYFFTFSDVHKVNTEHRCTKPLIYIHTHKTHIHNIYIYIYM